MAAELENSQNEVDKATANEVEGGNADGGEAVDKSEDAPAAAADAEGWFVAGRLFLRFARRAERRKGKSTFRPGGTMMGFAGLSVFLPLGFLLAEI